MKVVVSKFAGSVLLSAMLLVCAGCASVSKQFTKIARFIDGQDRIEMAGSTAEVTPLVPESADVFDPGFSGDEPTMNATKDDDPLSIDDSVSSNSTRTPSKREASSSAENEVSVLTDPKIPAKSVGAATLEKPLAPVSKPKSQNKSRVRKSLQQTSQINGKVLVKIDTKSDDEGLNKSIVRLIPLATAELSEKTSPATPSNDLVIDMKDKTYQPRYLAARKNDTVVFTNSDKIRHNVFSRSGKNAFDLGTYAAGKKRGVTFKETGIVKVYCNIHPDMATFVSVIDEGYSTITDSEGAFHFASVPTGEYALEAWNIRGKAESKISVQAEKNENIEVIISVLDPEFGEHQNKFGKKYPDKPILFEDEFY